MQILGAEFAKCTCRIWQVPSLTSAEFALSVGAELDRCRVVLYPPRGPVTLTPDIVLICITTFISAILLQKPDNERTTK